MKTRRDMTTISMKLLMESLDVDSVDEIDEGMTREELMATLDRGKKKNAPSKEEMGDPLVKKAAQHVAQVATMKHGTNAGAVAKALSELLRDALSVYGVPTSAYKALALTAIQQLGPDSNTPVFSPEQMKKLSDQVESKLSEGHLNEAFMSMQPMSAFGYAGFSNAPVEQFNLPIDMDFNLGQEVASMSYDQQASLAELLQRYQSTSIVAARALSTWADLTEQFVDQVEAAGISEYLSEGWTHDRLREMSDEIDALQEMIRRGAHIL